MRSLRILIADDEAVIRLGLRTMLEDHGYQVVGEAGDGPRALDLVQKVRPDLVFLDIKMPSASGLEVARTLLAVHSIPVIILTAYSDRAFVDEAKDAGVLTYLVKPIQENELMPAIELAMARFREIQALRQEIGDLQEALRTRKVVERAKGILMRVHGIDEAEAFARIQRQSRTSRRAMTTVAEEIIRSEQDPR